MGNISDKDVDEHGSWDNEKEADGHFDTIDRDFKYQGFSRSKARTPPNRSNSKDKGSSRRKSVGRSPSGRRRSSFKSKQSVKSRLIRRNSSVKSKDRGKGAATLLADMEVRVDGQVAKLVLRNSVVRRRAQAAAIASSEARLTSSPVLPTKNTSKSNSQEHTSPIPNRSPKQKRNKNLPKDSMKIQSTQELRHSHGLRLEKRSSYEKALSADTNDILPVIPAKPSSTESPVVHRVKNMNSAVNQLNRRSDIHVERTPQRMEPIQQKGRPQSTYANINNNNTKLPPNGKSSDIFRAVENRYKLKATKDNDELSGRFSKLVVSPITDV